jgi:hypothetical protein
LQLTLEQHERRAETKHHGDEVEAVGNH